MRLAESYPDHNILAVEREGDRVDHICRKCAQENRPDNIRVIHLESTYGVRYFLPADSVQVLHLTFPDPWPKKRHHKRRIMNLEFLEGVDRVLAPGGEFRFATDHEAYFGEVLEMLMHSKLTHYESRPWPRENDPAYPMTDFEEIWQDQDRAMHYLVRRKTVPEA